MSIEVPESAVPVRAQKLVSGILGDLESAMQRAAYLFKDGDEAMYDLFAPMALMAINKAGMERPKMAVQRGDVQYKTPYRGNRRDLVYLTECENWVDAIRKIHRSHSDFMAIKPGDYFYIPVNVPKCKINGIEYDALDTTAEAVVADLIDGRIIFQFEEILFFSAINKENTSKGGFQKSDLSAYLNDAFMSVFDHVKEFMVPNKYGKLITLPTRYELFGEGEDENGNWKDGYQLAYFQSIKNRIRVYENDTRWYWTSSSASAASFCIVYYSGYAGYHFASAVGGCAPAFCIS
ncbi:hypothetical protein FACS1894106_1470 [Spirochaetia bacterium]|nr:hypothetical protein FACS1894106_1470 [Spirochaetia bacterium]